MPFTSIEILLAAGSGFGRRVAVRDFLGKFSVKPGDPVEPNPVRARPWLPPEFIILRADVCEFEQEEDFYEIFLDAVRTRFLEAAAWLKRQPVALFKEFEAKGIVTSVSIILRYVDGDDKWVIEEADGEEDESPLSVLYDYGDADLFLELPPEFLTACGARRLPVYTWSGAEHPECPPRPAAP